MCVVFVRCETWWIFSSCFPRGVVWLTEARSYFMWLSPNCISGPGLSVSQQDKGIFPNPLLLALFCAVTEYNDHHHIQWILLAFFSGFCQCGGQLCGSRSTHWFCRGLISELTLGEKNLYCGELSSLNAIMRQLSNVHYHQSLTRSHLAELFQAAARCFFARNWQRLREWRPLRNNCCWLKVDKEWGLEAWRKNAVSEGSARSNVGKDFWGGPFVSAKEQFSPSSLQTLSDNSGGMTGQCRLVVLVLLSFLLHGYMQYKMATVQFIWFYFKAAKELTC